MNQFGRNFRVSIFGESHGEAVGMVIDGVKPGIALDVEDFEGDLARRRGGAPGTTPRKESDVPDIVSGIYNGRTTGAPLTLLFHNSNTRSGDYANLTEHPRPSHADWAAAQKFGGWNDPRGGGHFSGRLTLPLVAAGVVAKKMLPETVGFSTLVVEVGAQGDPLRFEQVIAEAQKVGDSVGGIVQVVVEGVPVGLGEPFFDSLESVAAHLIFSIPAVKGVEFGAGFHSARMRGSENNDPILSADGKTATNNAGGIIGGLTNGNPIVVTAAFKPTPSISRAQMTLNTASGRVEELAIKGRHDACVALRGAVGVEAAMAIALAELMG